jgi:hypothetical protein
MVDRFDRLRLQPVIGRHHEHRDVGDIGATRAHFGEGFVARRIEEGDLAPVGCPHLIGADMLGDAAGFARLDAGAAQRVEQAGLAVIDVAHDGDHRRAGLHLFGRIDVLIVADIDVGFADAFDLVPEFGDEQFSRILVDRLIDGNHHAHLEQRLDEIGALFGHAVRQFLHGDRVGNDDFGIRCERFSFSRARFSAARLRARAPSSSLSARVTVSLPDWRR